ncbi:MAG: fructosamine kinase family protein [Myxococcota bacterium]|nr:fructosamine kinase family protein [Myxococcota bacterium]
MSLESALQALLGQAVSMGEAVGGGDIAQPRRAVMADGTEVFVKSARGMPRGWVRAEAMGLERLAAVDCGIRVPQVLGHSEIPPVLALEWVEFGQATPAYWRALGLGLAELHRCSAEAYGFDEHGFIGRTPQFNGWQESWVSFFRDHRIVPLHRYCQDAGLLSEGLSADLHAICARMDSLLPEPEEGPSLLHGDLWSGNVAPDSRGQPVLFDPATYYGSREADLAMTGLFGGFDPEFYRAYQEAWPLPLDWQEREDLLNLYHLLNHVLLFGGAYLARCEVIARRFA